MARTNNLTNFLTDVAGAIKEKKGSQTAIPAANFDTEILALPSQGTYQQKSVTISSNTTTTITPDQNYDAIDELTVVTNVPTGVMTQAEYNRAVNTANSIYNYTLRNLFNNTAVYEYNQSGGLTITNTGFNYKRNNKYGASTASITLENLTMGASYTLSLIVGGNSTAITNTSIYAGTSGDMFATTVYTFTSQDIGNLISCSFTATYTTMIISVMTVGAESGFQWVEFTNVMLNDGLTAQSYVPYATDTSLQPKLDAIYNDTSTKLLPANVKSNVTILGVTGTYSGTINNQNKTVTPTTSQQSITADSGYTGLGTVTVNGVTSAIDNNITAGNIKKDVTILGVTGTYEGSGGGGVTYTELQYIQSSGTQYIDTGITPDATTEVEIRALGNSFPSGSNGEVLVGSRDGYNNHDFSLWWCVGNNQWVWGNGSTTIYNQAFPFKNEIIDITMGKGALTITNGTTTVTKTGSTTSNSRSIYLFNINETNSFKCLSTQIYSCKIYKNNELVRDFIPAKRDSDNAIGLYDKVSNTFFENQGTGTFTAGPEVGPISGFDLEVPNSFTATYQRDNLFDMELPEISGLSISDYRLMINSVRLMFKLKTEDDWHYEAYEDEISGDLIEPGAIVPEPYYAIDTYPATASYIGSEDDGESYHLTIDMYDYEPYDYENMDYKLEIIALHPTQHIYYRQEMVLNTIIPTNVEYKELYIYGTGINDVSDVVISVKDGNNNDIPYTAIWRGWRVILNLTTDKDGVISVTYNGTTETRTLDTTNLMNDDTYTYNFNKNGENIDFDNI